MDEKVTLKERKLIHDGTVLRMYADHMLLPDGSIETWDIVEHKFNASAIIPVLPDGRILLVNQYRSTCDRFTWEIPAGKNDGEDPKVCAERELMEETGYSGELIHLFSFRCAIAYSTEVVEIFLAKDVKKTGTQHLDPSEFINVKAFTLDELMGLIADGTIEDSKTITAILACQCGFPKL